jgi:hypothetical protein
VDVEGDLLAGLARDSVDGLSGRRRAGRGEVRAALERRPFGAGRSERRGGIDVSERRDRCGVDRFDPSGRARLASTTAESQRQPDAEPDQDDEDDARNDQRAPREP